MLGFAGQQWLDKIKSACDDIQEMRSALIVALNVKLEGRQ